MDRRKLRKSLGSRVQRRSDTKTKRIGAVDPTRKNQCYSATWGQRPRPRTRLAALMQQHSSE